MDSKPWALLHLEQNIPVTELPQGDLPSLTRVICTVDVALTDRPMGPANFVSALCCDRASKTVHDPVTVSKVVIRSFPTVNSTDINSPAVIRYGMTTCTGLCLSGRGGMDSQALFPHLDPPPSGEEIDSLPPAGEG